jgi:ABC-type phosphate/phosphonate transport system substrate-binding protein/tRNA A-37 threonylcarbamoyl transferase component Bud32
MVAVLERRMSLARTCRQCGARLAAEHSAEVCSTCLWQGALLDEDEPEIAPAPPAGPRNVRFCGDYELLGQIGRGGMGVVYRARKPALNKVFALKMLLHADTATAEELERLHIEAETAATIRHPNIVPVFDFGVSEGRHYIVMELIEGQSLAQAIAAKEFQMPRSRDAKARARARELQREIARLLATVAHAVEHAHQCRFLHRDIKPGNILLDAKGQPYLSDFGLAKALDGEKSISESGVVKGTINYMSPEQADGKRVGFPADVFSLGAVLYELLTGRPPFRGESIGETLRRLQETDPEHPRLLCQWVDTDLATVCLKCLEKDPNQRYSSAGDLAGDLDNWLANKPVRARPVRFFGRVWRWCRREPKIATMAGGLFLLLSAVALLTWTLYRREKHQRIGAEYVADRQLRVLINRIERDRKVGAPIYLPAEEVATLMRNELCIDGNEKRITLGSMLEGGIPVRLIVPLGAVTTYLRSSLGSGAKLPVLFNLDLFGRCVDAQEGLLAGRAGLMRADSAVYVWARQQASGLTPVVQEVFGNQPILRGAIITRSESGVTNLAGLKGRSLAFGAANSALGWHLPRAALAEAGLRAKDFARTTNCSSPRALSAVRTGGWDAGVVAWDDLEELTKVGVRFRVLRELRCPNQVWVATTNLGADTVNALRTALLSMQDTNILSALDHQLTGFIRTRPSDYDELAQQMEQAKQFDEPGSK